MSKKILLTLLMAVNLIQAKNVEFANAYLNQASPELVNLVDEVITEIGYQGNYELCEPNKAGLQINPNNGMICSILNPQTQNNLIIINPVWFNTLTKDVQKFLITRYLIKLEQTGGWLSVIAYIPFMLIALSFLIGFVLFKLINRTAWLNKKTWFKFLVIWLALFILNATVMPKLQVAAMQYASFKYEANLNQLVLAKLPNKTVATDALLALDQAIKARIQDGHNVFKSCENTFADLAKEINN